MEEQEENKTERRIRIVGTHHLVDKEKIVKEIEEFKPGIILVELCNGRISVIENPELKKKNRSLLGIISNILNKKSKKLGKQYGQDLITAYKTGKEKGIKIGLIDRPLVETQIFFKSIPLREKLILIKEITKLIKTDIKQQDIMSLMQDENAKEILKNMKEKVPTVFYFLLTSRDEYMISKIKSYLFDYKEEDILIFVGEGHRKTIEESLSKIKLESKQLS